MSQLSCVFVFCQNLNILVAESLFVISFIISICSYYLLSSLFVNIICFSGLAKSQYQVWGLNQLLTQPRHTNRNVNFVAVQNWNSIQNKTQYKTETWYKTNTKTQIHKPRHTNINLSKLKQDILDKQVEMEHTRWIHTFMKHLCLKLYIKHRLLYESSTGKIKHIWNIQRKHQILYY